MGCSSQILRVILIITIFMLLSLQNNHTSIGAENRRLVQKLHLMVATEFDNEKHIQKVSGDDDNERKETSIVERFRTLLGLTSPKTNSPSNYVSPSPSPSPLIDAEAPDPTHAIASPPRLPINAHSRPPLHHISPVHSPHTVHKDHSDKVRTRRVVTAVLVSVGAAFIVSALGFIWISGRFRRNTTNSAKRTVFRNKVKNRGKAKNVRWKKSASKVSLNPVLDLLYLTSLGRDIEEHSSCRKQPSAHAKNSSNNDTPNLTFQTREDSSQELNIRSECCDSGGSSRREIMAVHEEVESTKYESDGAKFMSANKTINTECHSSDDESFHSFVDSYSPANLLSNASAGSLTETSEHSLSKFPKTSPSRPSSSTNLYTPQATPDHISISVANLQQKLPQYSNNDCDNALACTFTSAAARPPPPPPPPPAPVPSRPLFNLGKSSSKSSTPSAFPNLMSSSLNCSSALSQKPKNDSSSSPKKYANHSQDSLTVPPPPCPPSFLKAKGPPPPPSQFPPIVPLGKDGAPLAKLKPLHWDKVRAAPDRTMVWDKMRSSSFELDEEMIESLFGYNLQGTLKNDEVKSKSPSPSKHVLEPKRLQNITILSKALNATADQVCEALIRGDGLGLQQLEALAKMAPTKEEEAKLCEYKGHINELGAAEKFVREVLRVPFAFARVEAMLYKETFEDEVVLLRNSFSMLEEACKELRSSRLFMKLLEAVLKTGNRMNVGTIRGGAKAFKLDALLKLADVKGTDGKTTLLHFVVQEITRSEGIRVADSIMGKINQKNKNKTIEEKEEDYRKMGLGLVAGLSTELYNVKKTATVDIDVLASSVSYLSDGMAKLQHLIQKDLSMDERSTKFIHSMKSFQNYAEKNLKELQEDEDKVMFHVREITEYFHGDVSKDEAKPLRIFVIVRDFLGMLDHVCKELRSLKAPSSPNPLAPFR
ncbi:hypothetical protein K2173_004782 [Erythroxylum novogranatense]|uniref:Formin-like protein n=1 Tax=Erythroxylum novogranatense TaxID=1862640 RepID=A0AAV8SKG3_9ROSI|nr:hypothetical protein K2173_004782 [Erythroxylum novogranatense]